MKITALLIPLIFSSVVSSPVNEQNKPTDAVDVQKFINILKNLGGDKSHVKACLTKDIVLDKLNSTLLEEELMKAIKLDSKDIKISLDENMCCALNVTKNSESGNFKFAYKMIPTVNCPNQNDIICDMQSNCTSALKCCNSSAPICLNFITIKPVKLDYNSGNSKCTGTNETSCYELEPISNRTFVVPTKKNSATAISTSNPSNYIAAILLYLFAGLQLNK